MPNNPFLCPPPDEDEKTPYALVGWVRSKPESADDFERLLLATVEPTRKEDGLLTYHVHRDRSDRSLFFFYEVWRSIDDLHRHFDEPHICAFLEDRKAFVDGDPNVNWLRMVSPFQHG